MALQPAYQVRRGDAAAENAATTDATASGAGQSERPTNEPDESPTSVADHDDDSSSEGSSNDA